MKQAEPIVDYRYLLSLRAYADVAIWRLPRIMPGSSHCYKYRLAFVVDGDCLLRYDNEAGKGDHRHVKGRETPYRFVDIDELQEDFWREIDEWSPPWRP
jgi:hypothetical protein